MEITLGQLVFYLSTGSALLTTGMHALLGELAKQELVNRLRRQLFRDVEELQNRLFGLHRGQFGAIRGLNKWASQQNPKRYFGVEHLQKDAVPPYDYVGLANLHALYSDLYFAQEEDPSFVLEECRDILIIGGRSINPAMGNAVDDLQHLPFQFVDKENVQKQFVSSDWPDTFRRTYVHDDGEVFSKQSYRNKYLVAVDEPGRPPFGPFIDASGRLQTDVILLTIAPAAGQRRLVLVRPGHGAGSRLADVMASGDHLERLAGAIDGRQPGPWLQAVFTVPVQQDEAGEHYGLPELAEVVPLGG
jgi:hypothetical protein